MSLTPALPPVITKLESLQSQVTTLSGQIEDAATAAPMMHASSSATSIGAGSATLFGHVKLSDVISASTATDGVAATPGAVNTVNTTVTALSAALTALTTRVTTLETNHIKNVYPVGAIYMTFTDENPATTFGFGTWERLEDGRVLVGSTAANTTGGSETHTMTINEMPEHAHQATAARCDPHSHGAGSLEIKGSFKMGNSSTTNFVGFKDATLGFSLSGTGTTGLSTTSSTYGDTTVVLDATADNGGVVGGTGSDGAHTHTLTVDKTGCSTAFSVMQPYRTVFMWKRTA